MKKFKTIIIILAIILCSIHPTTTYAAKKYYRIQADVCYEVVKGEKLPLEIKNSTIYYMGPSPAREGRPIGSAGPTTASRMDKYAPTLLDLGQKAMIGKGKRSKEVIDAIVRNKAVYFAAIGGAGALLSKSITHSEVIAYDDLGTEAIRKLEVKNFPVVVVIDSKGNNLYETAIEAYRQI